MSSIFFNVMECSRDVAGLLTSISTVNGHLPTGSCVSQILAFFTHKILFDDLEKLAADAGLDMTCYVDDIAVSGDRASGLTLHAIRKRIHQAGLKTNRRKERRYCSNRPKEVTGVIISNGQAMLPNRHHKKIHESVVRAGETSDTIEREALISSAVDRLQAAAQIDKRYGNRARWLRKAVRRSRTT